MPYEVETKDGIVIRNIPDDIPPDDQRIKDRVAAARAQRDQEQPETTLSGVAGAATRGLGPIAAGAAVGAAAGAPFAGVGAIPGAAAGAGAAGLAMAVGDPIVKTVNNLLGTTYTLPTDALNDLFTKLGVPEPRTEAERVVQATSAGLAGAGGGMALGKALTTMEAPLARSVGGVMMEAPAAQLLGGAGAGAASQAAAEQGGGVVSQLLAGTAGGMAGGAAVGGLSRAINEAQAPVPGARTPPPLSQQLADIAPAAQPEGSSVGAMQAEQGLVRQAKASELDVPIALTAGQRTRDFGQTQFERETAKQADMGAPLRERFAEQNKQLAQNLEVMAENTGMRAGDTNYRRVVGEVTSDFLERMLDRQKLKVRTLYKRARDKGQMNDPVEIPELATFLNENRAMQEMVPLLKGVVRQLEVSGVGGGDLTSGTVSVRPMTLDTAETVRQFINNAADYTDPRQASFAGRLKDIIDASTEGKGGEAYKAARAARVEQKQMFDDVGLVKALVSTKRGSTDRQIAYEQTLDRVLSDSTPTDSVEFLRKLLTDPKGKRKSVAEEGKTVWAEIQGSVLQEIRKNAMSASQSDQAGNAIFSADKLNKAISRLDQSGKLDVLFEPKQAEKLRILSEVAKDVLTVPPGSVNTSNTTSALLAALGDAAFAANTMIPVPVLSIARAGAKEIKDRKLRARVEAALRGEVKK